MNALQNPAYLWPYIIANAAGLLFLVIALRKPQTARILFALLFGWACWFNYTTAHQHPEVYLGFADFAVREYRHFIHGWFKDHIALMVTLISMGQALIALGMLGRGIWVRLACLGAIVFLFAIAPLGVGSGFPVSFTVSGAAYLVLRHKKLPFLWEAFGRKKTHSYERHPL